MTASLTRRFVVVPSRRALALAAIAAACASDTTGPETVASVTVSPAQVEVQAGSSATLVATPRGALGTPLSGRTIAWTTSDTAVASVTGAGVVSARRQGTATITATSEGVAGRATVTVIPGPPAQLVFTVPPRNVAAGAAFAPPLEVTARDALGNPATSFASTVTLTLATDPGGATLGGTTTTTAVAGVATFPGISLDKSAVGYTLQAAATGLTPVTSAPFTVTPGPAAQLAFTVPPGTTAAGAAITPALEITARDAFGNVATGFTGTVTIAIGANPPGTAVLSGTTSVTATAGVARFADLSIDQAGAGYTLVATAGGLPSTTSAPFTVSPAAAARLVFTVQPSDAIAGNVISPAVRVTALDAFGNPATSFTGSVTLAIGTDPSGRGRLEGTTSVTAIAGVATFGNLNIDEAGAGFTLTAASPGVSGATSDPFTISPGVAAQLSFTVQPTPTTAGALLTPAVEVTALDVFGNVATGFTGTISLAIGVNPPGNGVLDGTRSVAATAGVATFGDLRIDEAGVGYTLTAAAAGVAGATSTSFDIVPGAPVRLAFTVQPANTVANEVIAPAVRVRALDASGNTATGFVGTISIAILDNPGGGTLFGTLDRNAVAGVASFGDLRIDRAASGYTLRASASGLTGATSTAFIIDASGATQLTFTVQPSGATAGALISPAVEVTARDDLGNAVPAFSGSVTIAIGANPGGSTLSGVTTVAAVGGVATFNVSLDRSASGYTLVATASGLVSATSTPFAIAPAAASALRFEVHPTTATAGTTIAPPVRVRVVDPFGNTVATPQRDVTISLARDPAEAHLSGTLTAQTGLTGADSGVATLANLSVDKVATGYTLEASSPGLVPDTSLGFDITPGTATHLVFTTQPTPTVAGTEITPAVRVAAHDALGNVATGFMGMMTVAIAANPGNGTLSGTATVAAVAGVATFATLSIDKSAAGYTLAATAAGLTSGTSVPFTIAPGPASRLVVAVQPGETVVDAAIMPPVEVRAHDAFGNTATEFTSTVSLAIGTNPGGGTLSGTTTRNAVAGVTAFSGLRIDRVGTGYTLAASAAGLVGTTTAAFNVVAANPADHLAFTVQPSATTAGAAITPAVEVMARDAQGNPATGFTGPITVAIAANPAGGTLSGTTTVAATAGIATFSTLSIDREGAGYTLEATAAGLTAATSAAFSVTPPAAISASLSSVVAATDTIGACLAPCVTGAGASTITVTVRDELGAPMRGVAVTLSASPADSTVFANPGASGVTDPSGEFRADFSAGQPIPRTLSATADGVLLDARATVTVMPVLIGAGDIADCAFLAHEATAALLDGLPGQVITLGDNAYPDGTADEFANCYDVSWGRHRERTRPSAGNRDYNTPDAVPYYAYFGASANPLGGTGNSQGYYSYDLGTWHIVVLNSEILRGAGSPQLQWLRQDLNGRRNQCVLAYWHKPRFASRNASTGVDVMWQTVADSGVDLVLNGHAHLYERFAPMNALGEASPTGTRLVIVGTGGASLSSSFATDPPNSVVRDRTTHGVLRVTLYADWYRWEFIPAPGFGTFTDSGTGNCN